MVWAGVGICFLLVGSFYQSHAPCLLIFIDDDDNDDDDLDSIQPTPQSRFFIENSLCAGRLLLRRLP
jgi:hypothetical protein